MKKLSIGTIKDFYKSQVPEMSESRFDELLKDDDYFELECNVIILDLIKEFHDKPFKSILNFFYTPIVSSVRNFFCDIFNGVKRIVLAPLLLVKETFAGIFRNIRFFYLLVKHKEEVKHIFTTNEN